MEVQEFMIFPRNLLLVICFLLLLSGCGAWSDITKPTPREFPPTEVFVEITPTASPTELSMPVEYLPTATARPSLNKLVSPTPALSLSPLAPLIDILAGVVIVEKLDYDFFVTEKGSNAISYRHANGVVEIKNKNDWDRIDDYSPFLIKEGEGVIFKFMLPPYSYRPKIFFEAITGNGAILQWGIRPTLYQETFVRRDYIDLLERVIPGSLRVKQGEWYYLLMTIEKDANFRAVVWNPANPEIRNEVREQLNPEWFAMQWTPEVRIKSGQVNIDEYMKIVINGSNE